MKRHCFFQKPSWDECGSGGDWAYSQRSFPCFDRLSLEELPALMRKAGGGGGSRRKKSTQGRLCADEGVNDPDTIQGEKSAQI
ncbi:hypothetical protein JT27_09945 [Alcaligenes faecalis]|nr:hypothetical protein JT27_09945 [Alcaligenes faecalis]